MGTSAKFATESIPPPPPEQRLDPLASSKRVLVADDEISVLYLYARVLEKAGCEVTVAKDGAEALAQVQSKTFDAIVSDIIMPQTDGIQLLQAVRKIDLDVPVIFITASPSVSTAAAAVREGALRYLVKPVALADLAHEVTQAIGLCHIARLRRETLRLYGRFHQRAVDRSGLEVRFNNALQQLWIAYQPIIRWSTKHVFAYEALVRSREPAMPNPGAILDAAERLHRVHELGRAIRAAITSLWATMEGDAKLFVNLHATDLADDQLYDANSDFVQLAKRVVLEVTERASLEEVPEIRERTAALRKLGFRIAIDDLGAGYAGLASFAVLEPDIVKLDMALIRGIHREPTMQKLIRTMTSLCRDLGKEVIAEGVETPEERDMLLALGCDLFQGFLFALPEEQPPSVAW